MPDPAVLAGNVSVAGNTVLGSSSSSSLTVNSPATFNEVVQAASLQVSGSSTLGSAQAASLQVSSSSTLGTTASDTLTVKAVARFTAGSTLLYGSSGDSSTSAVLGFQRRLGTAAVSAGTVLGQVQFTGWDGIVDGLGAQIRSVFTVSLLWSQVCTCIS